MSDVGKECLCVAKSCLCIVLRPISLCLQEESDEEEEEQEEDEESHLWARLEEVSEKFNSTNERYSELERDEGLMKDVRVSSDWVKWLELSHASLYPSPSVSCSWWMSLPFASKPKTRC